MRSHYATAVPSRGRATGPAALWRAGQKRTVRQSRVTRAARPSLLGRRIRLRLPFVRVCKEGAETRRRGPRVGRGFATQASWRIPLVDLNELVIVWTH